MIPTIIHPIPLSALLLQKQRFVQAKLGVSVVQQITDTFEMVSCLPRSLAQERQKFVVVDIDYESRSRNSANATIIKLDDSARKEESSRSDDCNQTDVRGDH